MEHLNNKNRTTQIKNTHSCFIQNCNYCSKKNQCEICKEGYKLKNSKCYNTECSIYGKCKYCTEFDCVYCEKGYKISYGFCEIDDSLYKIQIILGIIFPIIFCVSIIIICVFFYKKKKKIKFQKIYSAEIIKKKKTNDGQYIIINTTNVNNSGIISLNDDDFNNEKDKLNEKEKLNQNKLNHCILCDNSIFSFSKCGCGLCKEHAFLVDYNEICPIHKIPLEEKLVIKMEKKKLMKKKSFEDYKNVKICPVCKIEKGIVNFNCGCPCLLCNKCFNDNVYVFKFNKCPGCGKSYNYESK
jgi:uncharacterized membrane protein YciS (DUF1049 family)